MPLRYQEYLDPAAIKFRPFLALRATFKAGYTLADFKADLMAGLIVALVAIPLAMALAIASGVAPQYGLYTVIVGGAVVALLGGSKCQVTGPTAAFVVILMPIAQQFGFAGLLMAGFIAGVILVLMGVMKLGRFIQFIPYPVTTGFTTGIAIVIALIQLKDFMGLSFDQNPQHFTDRIVTLYNSIGSFDRGEFFIGATTLAILLAWSRFSKKLPAPLVALSLVSIGAFLLNRFFPQMDIATIGSSFTYTIKNTVGQGIPQAGPSFAWPWTLGGAGGAPFTLSLETIKALIPSATAIAMLGAIESLLSAVVADGMAQTKHDPDAELIALGVGNMICPFFGGIAATGAIARTATNIRFGARSPIAAIMHSLFTLCVVLLFAPLVSFLPMAALAALLLLVAFNMSEYKHFSHILRVGPRSDALVLVLCCGLTVVFDMVIGVTVGVIFAALLFMRRMATVTSGKRLEAHELSPLPEPLPREIMLYEIAGPLFFGAAEKAMETINRTSDSLHTVIFVLSSVPMMDMTGLVAFETTVKTQLKQKRKVILAGVKHQPESLLRKSGLLNLEDVILCRTVEEAIEMARFIENPIPMVDLDLDLEPASESYKG